ncbi:hypothetical protein FPV67DRAFT_1664020 [Lyophyllum atratum]|nr:hypothetical protein FPV67DRAFT_1664020 [Lyophyllum atratum]
MVDIARNQGALLIGGLIAAGLSGIVTVQAILYFKLYPLDSPILKVLACPDPFLSSVATNFCKRLRFLLYGKWVTPRGLACAAIWNYLIQHFGRAEDINIIPLTLSLTIVFTVSLLPGTVHPPLNSRLAGNSYFLRSLLFRTPDIPPEQKKLVPNVTYSLPRDLSALFGICAEMIRLQMFTLFKAQFRWLFSMGLAMSSIVDIVVTLSLFALLQNSRSRSLSLNHIIDSLILYTFEMGSLTCAGTIVSMICWLTMNDNLIFMGLHFVIGKLYANSLLASLNTRHDLRRQRHSLRDTMIAALDGPRRPDGFFHNSFLVGVKTSPSSIHSLTRL